MSRQEKAWIKPGYLSQVFRADERRMEFDCKNQTIIQKECPVDIVFIGDSITQMWELEAYFHQYHLMILNRVEIAPNRFFTAFMRMQFN